SPIRASRRSPSRCTMCLPPSWESNRPCARRRERGARRRPLPQVPQLASARGGQPLARPVAGGAPAPRARASRTQAELLLLRGPHRAAPTGAGVLGRALGDAGRLGAPTQDAVLGRLSGGPGQRAANGCTSIERPKK